MLLEIFVLMLNGASPELVFEAGASQTHARDGAKGMQAAPGEEGSSNAQGTRVIQKTSVRIGHAYEV